MTLQEYKNTLRQIRAPQGTQARILEACRAPRRRGHTARRLVPAAVLAILLAVVVPVFGGQIFAPTLALYATASDVTGEVDLGANGVLEWGEGTLFLSFGRSGGDIDRVDLYNEAGRLSCWFEVENAGSGAVWSQVTLSIPYADYAAYVRDTEYPERAELSVLLQAESRKSSRFDGVTDEMERFAQQYGTAEIDFEPLITGFDILEKGNSKLVAVYLENPESAVLEPVHGVQALSVAGGEGVEWYLNPAEAGTGFTDVIEVGVRFENGRTLSGRIKIEWENGGFRASFETDG